MELPVPFSEPAWHSTPSSIYKETHRRWQKTCREFIDKTLTQHALEWEKAGQVPEHVFQSFAKANFLVPALHPPLPLSLLQNLGLDPLPGGLPAKEFDALHSAIFFDEMARSGLLGIAGSITAGISIGLPPILEFASQSLQEKIVPDLLLGKKRVCLAITEPEGGSDVANLHTTAEKTPDGKFYVVNGAKKWITNGIWSQYACMCVRTGGPGRDGLSLLAVPLLGHPGVSVRKIHTSGQSAVGTSYIDLDDVKVPVENLIGEEGMGMKYVMTNFNHERITVTCTVLRQCRAALGAAFGYCMKREAFGKPLMDQPVVRHRLARVGSDLEGISAWVDQVLYQLTQLSKEEADRTLGGVTAMLKAQSTRVLVDVANTATLLFGGAGFTKGGQGDLVEQIYREVNGSRIPAGSEDVLFDLGIRQLVKLYLSAQKDANKKAKI